MACDAMPVPPPKPTAQLDSSLRQLQHIQEAIDRGVAEAAIDAQFQFFGPAAFWFVMSRPPRRTVTQ